MIQVILGLVTIVTVGGTLANLVQCSPMRKIWDHDVDGFCINITTAVLTVSALSLVTDVVILALPMSHIWGE